MSRMTPIDVADAALERLETLGEDVSDLRRDLALSVADRCVCCGEIVPEGRMVCKRCELDYPAIKCTLPGGKPPGVTNEKEDRKI